MQRGTEHRFDAVIVADITPRNGVFKEIIGQKVGHNYPYLPQMKLRHFDVHLMFSLLVLQTHGII
jgi:hypothetical protein